jgi:hypothetical protein
MYVTIIFAITVTLKTCHVFLNDTSRLKTHG